jgi:hypothetical protein
MLAKPGVLLRLEGAAMFASSLLLYRFVEARWAVVFVLFLWPDLFMVGYLLNPKLGARLYNLAHTETLPLGARRRLPGRSTVWALDVRPHLGGAYRRGSRARLRTEVSDVLQGHACAAGESMTVAMARRSTVQSSTAIRRSA